MIAGLEASELLDLKETIEEIIKRNESCLEELSAYGVDDAVDALQDAQESLREEIKEIDSLLFVLEQREERYENDEYFRSVYPG